MLSFKTMLLVAVLILAVIFLVNSSALGGILIQPAKSFYRNVRNSFSTTLSVCVCRCLLGFGFRVKPHMETASDCSSEILMRFLLPSSVALP